MTRPTGTCLAVILTAILALAYPAAADDDLPSLVDRQVQPVLDAGMAVGFVVGTVKDGETHVFAYGETEKDSGTLPDGDTIYEIGSITKVFTGILLADMVERGLVALDDPVQKHLATGVTMPKLGDESIRMVDLATHASGLPRLPDNMPFGKPMNPYVDYTPKLLFAFLNEYQLTRPLGQYEYSNLGMGLLGHVLATKAGKTYEQLVIERICQPLAMNDTQITLNDSQRARLALPYRADLSPNHLWDFDVLAGCGALRSTAHDMLKFIQAHLEPDEQPVATALHKAQEIHGEVGGGMGIGLAWHRARDNTTYWHNGGTGGYKSYLAIHPTLHIGVVLLSNTTANATDIVGEKLIQVLAGLNVDPIQLRTVVEVAPEVLARYAGYYELTPQFGLTVTVEEGQLMIQASAQPKVQAFAESDTKFFLKVVDAQLTFERSDDGTVDKLILHQNGQDLTGTRKENP